MILRPAIRLINLAFIVLFLGCATKFLHVDKSEEVLKVDEYDQKMNVKAAAEPPAPVIKEAALEKSPEKATDKTEDKGKTTGQSSDKSERRNDQRKEKTTKAADKADAKKADKPKGARQPDIEDTEGFDGRRPLVDPFRPGEKVTLNVTYFNIVAGTMDLHVHPMVEVNGQRAYHFEVDGKTNSMFSKIYAVDDKAITYVNYDELVPLNLQISIKESNQLAETRTFFDWKNNKANYWQKKITKEKGERSKKLEWNIGAYSQNVVSAAFYLRTFKLTPGKKLAFRVADEGKNIVFKGEILRREKLKTEIGELNTVVIKPHLTVDGVFKPVGDILIWLTDDDRKFLVRLESKIKIGTLIAKLKSIEKGRE